MTAPNPGWSSRRWIGVTALLTLLHAGGFWLVARFPGGPSLGRTDAFAVIWSTTSPDPLEGTLSSPTRFALPEASGFSGDAAQALPPVTYGWGRTEPKPSFLPADPAGSNLGPLPPTPVPPARPTDLRTAAPASDSLARITLEHTRVDLLGALAQRGLMRPLKATVWTEGDSPQPTRIEVAVNPWGEVLTARVTVGSGSKAADLAALEAVWNARFNPLPQARQADALQADPLTWGLVSIHPIPGTPPQGPAHPL